MYIILLSTWCEYTWWKRDPRVNQNKLQNITLYLFWLSTLNRQLFKYVKTWSFYTFLVTYLYKVYQVFWMVGRIQRIISGFWLNIYYRSERWLVVKIGFFSKITLRFPLRRPLKLGFGQIMFGSCLGHQRVWTWTPSKTYGECWSG